MFLLFQIPSLKAPHVHMRDREAVVRTIDKIREGGAKRLQV